MIKKERYLNEPNIGPNSLSGIQFGGVPPMPAIQ